MLKKIICFILSMTMGLALCACGAEQGAVSYTHLTLPTKLEV